MPITKAIVPVSSTDARLCPATRRQPRAMLPLGRTPALQIVLDELVGAGVRDICIVGGPDIASVERHFESDKGPEAPPGSGRSLAAIMADDVRLQYIMHPDVTDPGEALVQAEWFVGDEPFVLAHADVVISDTREKGALIRRMLRTMDATAADAVVATREIPRSDVSSHTIGEPIGEPGGAPHFVLDELVDRPVLGETKSNLALSGRFVLAPIIFNYLHDVPRPISSGSMLALALRRLAHDRDSVWAVMLQMAEQCFDLESFLLYSRAFLHFSLEDPEVGIALREYLEELMAN